MTKTKHEFLPCVPGAFRGGLRRTEFYDGMVLSEDDMKREQSYWQMKRRLTNRALGQGVVWGLSVHWDEKARTFTLCPGYGLSCCGDDLVVECPETICERDLIDICSEDFREILKAAQGPCADPCDRRPDAPVEACLLLEYVECPEDPRQVFEDPCATRPGGCRFGAVRETTRLRLVPPPPPPKPGPVERFCEKIGKLKSMLAEAGFEPESSDTGTAPAGGLSPDIGVAVAFEDASGNVLETKKDLLASADGSKVELSRADAAVRRLRVTLSPPIGYGFMQTAEEGADEKHAETLMGLTFSESDLAEGGVMDRRPTALIAPLAGGMSTEVAYRITARREGDTTRVVAEVATARARPRVPDCATLMKRWIFDVDPLCATRTILLAMVCGWFKGLLGAAPCNEPADEPNQTRAAIAWLVCWLAWRILWKIDISKEKEAEAERCLRKLFQEWCAEFHYRGPRCECHVHGILLGCMEISPKGRVLCFDEWEHRRYVLTGPLLTHWSGLFGIAPLDVMATRLASWICCVARTPSIDVDPDTLAAIRKQLLSDDGELRLGGDAMIDIQPLLSPGGIFADFKGHVGKPSTEATIGTGTSGFDAQLGKRIEAKLDTAPVMVKAPTLDLVRAMKSAVTLADLKPVGDPAMFDATVAAMEKAEIATADELFALDPERTATRLRAALVEGGAIEDASGADKAVALVYTAAFRALEAVGAAVVAEAEERAEDEPFTRADLKEASTAVRKAINEHLRGRGLSSAAVKTIATRVADRR